MGKVIAASAATVAVTFLGMVFTRLSIFSTVGIALAVGVAIACLSAVTFLPALMVLAGRRGWIKPRRDPTSRFWRRSGIRIVRKPGIHRRQPGHPVALCELSDAGQIQLRRPQSPAARRRQLRRVQGARPPLPVESDHPAIHLHSFPIDLWTPQAPRRSGTDGAASPKFRESPSSAALPAPPGNPRASPAQLPGGRSGHPIARRVHPDQRSFRRPGSAQERGQPVGGQPGTIRGQVSQAITTVRDLSTHWATCRTSTGRRKRSRTSRTRPHSSTTCELLGSAIGTNLANVLDLTPTSTRC